MEDHEKHDGYNNQCGNGVSKNYECDNDEKSCDTVTEDKEARLEG